MIPEGWRHTKFGKIAREVSEKNFDGREQRVLSVTKYDGFVPSLEYFDRQVFSRDTSTYKIVRKGQFAYATIHLDEGSLGWLRDFDAGVISPMYTVFEIDERLVDGKFLYELMKSPQMLLEYKGLGHGSVNRRKSISFKNLATLKLKLPPLPEQKKIAAILSSVDEAIEATEAVIEQTRTVKKGLLQELLTRGIGHREFKKTAIGEIPKSWEVVKIEKVAERGSGHTPNKKKPDYWDGEIRWVSLTDSSKLDQVFIYETESRITPAGIANSSARLHPEGTVLVSRDAGIGKSAIMASPMAVSQHFITWNCGPRLHNLFLYYWLQSQKPFLEAIATGSTIKTIGLGFFKKWEMPLPPVDEQKRIGRNLLSLDEAIWANEDKVKQLKTLKKGLLQDLLTGKVRVGDVSVPVAGARPALAPAE